MNNQTGNAQALTDEQIKKIALANGFTLKEENDLRPYVYSFARALLAAQPQVIDKSMLKRLAVQHGFDLVPVAAQPSALPDVADDPDDDPAFCKWREDHDISMSDKWVTWSAWCAAMAHRGQAVQPLPAQQPITSREYR
jgi:hypothetical protein